MTSYSSWRISKAMILLVEGHMYLRGDAFLGRLLYDRASTWNKRLLTTNPRIHISTSHDIHKTRARFASADSGSTCGLGISGPSQGGPRSRSRRGSRIGTSIQPGVRADVGCDGFWVSWVTSICSSSRRKPFLRSADEHQHSENPAVIGTGPTRLGAGGKRRARSKASQRIQRGARADTSNGCCFLQPFILSLLAEQLRKIGQDQARPSALK